MNPFIYIQLLICLAFLAVDADLFQRQSAKVWIEDIVRKISSSTATSCVLSCKNSNICKQPAISEDGACLHLKRAFTSSISVKIFEPVQHPAPIESGKANET